MTNSFTDIPDLTQAAQALLQGDYEQAILSFQALAESEPTVKSHYWYLGLALLLQGQEAEAQATWMLAMVEGSSDQISQWTAELVGVLEAAADRQETLTHGEMAWGIRQHIREIDPTNLANLIHSLRLALTLKYPVSQAIEASGLLTVLRVEPPIPVEEPLLLKVLQQLLQVAGAEPIVLEFAEICLLRVADPVNVVFTVINYALDLANAYGQAALAVQYAELCLKVHPNNLHIWAHLFFFNRTLNRQEEALAAARKVCTLAATLPDQIYGAYLMVPALMRAGNYWNQVFAIVEHQGQLIAELTRADTEPLDQTTVLQLVTSTFYQPYIRDSLALNRQAQNRMLALCQTGVDVYEQERITRYQQGFRQRRQSYRADRPLKIGYFSYCLRRHSVGWLSRWLLMHHDHQQFQLYGYFWSTPGYAMDDVQRWFSQQVHTARFLGRDSQEIAEQIFADEIDILIDLDSLTADIACEVMMLKPAPVQVTWLGWDASGIPAIDYYIADPYVLPAQAEEHYTEKIWRLPETYLAVDGFEIGVPTVRREDLEIPADAVIYWSGQSAYKRHPDTVRAQMRIIKAVPGSYFLIKGITDNSSIQQYFLELAAELEVEATRLRFLPDTSSEEAHRANLAIADVVLDTYPYNGATTTMETLWMGIPLVTRVGDHFSSRNSYTMMRNAGITEGIAYSEAEYIDWGIRLGKEPELRQQIAWKLWQSRQTAPLWNTKRFARAMESAYQQMWQIYLEEK